VVEEGDGNDGEDYLLRHSLIHLATDGSRGKDVTDMCRLNNQSINQL